MRLKNLAFLFSLAFGWAFGLSAQQPAPTSGEITVTLAEPIDFATARPLQAVRSTVIGTTNPAVPAGSFAVLQLQNRDGSYALKLLRLSVSGQVLKTMSQPGVSVGGSPATGPHASLANGAVLRFTLTNPDGTPGSAVVRANPASAAAATPAAQLRNHAQPEYVLEGVGLGMTKEQVQEAGKAHGSVKGLTTTDVGYYQMKTSDLMFGSIQFSDSGVVASYTVQALNPKHLKVGNTSGPLYEMVIAAFGKPTMDGNESKWGFEKKTASTALYNYDKSEAPNGELVVISGQH